MNFKVYTTPNFEKQLKRLAKKYASLSKDFAPLVTQLQKTPTLGTNLGNNCYKIRLAIRKREIWRRKNNLTSVNSQRGSISNRYL
jgi:mRNA-degrading endonuclease RelE of RelBE toxin-antitoxin system